ncbi:4-(cytidine 5'-diphospho)-2-C-methyl-D-erythritol kinase [Umezakia ovalisporum]|jgi:4-diphosphocytidyl-2-C-methyl-D-erythritol kinase|uniref:4-diphosphocytidyl-2-C-methyl-D-erythritol kinase n=1 Tax=Umezakia ovalisporum FSS-43 TaxID=2740520 RepID=A0ABT6K8L2_9CYAN|nr:4-(cytidine 5'-diphospho)-2-C-methyl-D-erythritol kinase [Umezakia ovalisporum]MDH6058644.1 4-(cytidine 5'-diphospho)-2-C-methyl-D-erythritol kinase [Umezakia ovalisporum FSS-43]MDH6066779.1 4-(cytidine 5'-diphospho)-2-C-methyl-D-erythritol kinase [Umezakia ovalisporum APH033B]MDH6070460.1 4-(cytidine 5'-diphospho)-2-C-methyl-D-erythritol kinase [Umezakia ovalisporum CobakiLakeA]MDH6073973.1 4-(cytidine 5'-diphospho)-2-C-methyl-D-erythritol kinase [Umezakia ovalisporum CS-1034]MDH6079656.1 
MRSYTLIAPAKINLYLEIISDRPDGYHELAMILQSIELADEIHLQPLSNEKICVNCNHPQVPTNESNLAYRAAALMATQFPQALAKYGGVEITIRKHIPVAAGLAGGSTNAAAVLMGIDLLWDLGLTKSELEELGATLGSDVPFCVAGGTVIATGRGEQLSPLPSLDHTYMVLAKYRSLEVSTAWAYKTYRQEFSSSYLRDTENLAARAAAVHSEEIVKAILKKDPRKIAEKLHNDLERVVLPAYPQVLQLRELFASQEGVLGTMMSGSGPTVFALVESEQQAQAVKLQMRTAIPDENLELFVTRTITHGIQMAQST